MRRQKRDPVHRSYLKGYQAAIHGRSLNTCPYQMDSPLGYHWSRGWREGREDHWSGYNEFTFQQKAVSL